MKRDEVLNQLSLFLGLDDETLRENVLPHLESMKTRAELQDYLTGLLGNDAAQASFIRSYSTSRFPAAAAAPTQTASTAKPTAQSHQRPSQASSSNVKMASAPRQAAQSTPQASTATPASRYTPQPSTSSSNAKIQVVQAPAVNVALPSTSGPSSVQARTMPMEDPADVARRRTVQIERQLRAAKGQSKERSCFCQAQDHPLSPVAPICPRCVLVLCDLNIPYSRSCPSCDYSLLVNDGVLANYIAKQEAELAEIMSQEKERLRFESEEEERARRAIQFPDLQDGRTPSPSGGTSSGQNNMGYARKAGGGLGHYESVEQAYRNAQAREQAIAASGERRVLTLNAKTKKVQYQTTKPAGSKTKQQQQAAETLAKQKKGAKQVDLEDDRKAFIDELDDGKLEKTAAQQQRDSRPPLDFSWPPKQGSGLKYVPRDGAGKTSLSDDVENEEDANEDAESIAGEIAN